MIKRIFNIINKIKISLVYFFYNLRNFFLKLFIKNKNTNFNQKGFSLIKIENHKNLNLEKIFNKSFYTSISNKKNFFFLNSYFSSKILDNLNTKLIYIDCKKVQKIFFTNLIEDVYKPIKDTLNSNWRCVQIRAWITKKNSTDNIGPLKFHTDGMPNSVYKIMIFPKPLNTENGSIEIENEGILRSLEPTALLFKNSSIMHKAIAGKEYDRPVIELTIVRNLFANKNFKISDLNSTIPLIIISI